ncbi:MAG: DOMON-like domain-containing protein [Pseudomonadota bacterium]|nr:DOMON-like domain-containing protein [Pseudomonadota bacterium]
MTAIRARITGITQDWLTLRWSIAGAGRVVLPALAGKHRADGLWRHTCFEMFLQSPGRQSYVELNLSPSEGWAAYDFTGYRQGMIERAMPRQPDCTARVFGKTLIFDAAIPLAGLPPRPWLAGLTAVIEEEGGVVSYWSLAHPPGPPDFHHAACLALQVPAPGQKWENAQ